VVGVGVLVSVAIARMLGRACRCEVGRIGVDQHPARAREVERFEKGHRVADVTLRVCFRERFAESLEHRRIEVDGDRPLARRFFTQDDAAPHMRLDVRLVWRHLRNDGLEDAAGRLRSEIVARPAARADRFASRFRSAMIAPPMVIGCYRPKGVVRDRLKVEGSLAGTNESSCTASAPALRAIPLCAAAAPSACWQDRSRIDERKAVRASARMRPFSWSPVGLRVRMIDIERQFCRRQRFVASGSINKRPAAPDCSLQHAVDKN